MKSNRIIIYIFLFVLFFLCHFQAIAQESGQDYTAATTVNPQVPIEDLKSLLKPLTKEELIVEADAWRDLLKNKAEEIGDLEIQQREKNREIARSKEEIEQTIEQIQQSQQQLETQQETPQNSSQQISDANDTVAQAQQQLQERVETINQTISQANNVTPAVIDSNSEQELSRVERDLVARTEEVNEARLNLQRTIEEIAVSDISLEEKVQKIGEAEQQLNARIKDQIGVTLTKLREERTAITDRFRIVLTALELKGGDITDYEKYIEAVLQLTVEVDDINAFWIMISGWLKSSEGGLRWLNNIFFFLLILIITFILASITSRITNRAVSRSKRFSNLLKKFFVSIASKTVFIIGLIMALSQLGFDIAPILAGLGVAGFVIGFALQGTLSNFASGLMILIYRPYDVGNVIEAAGVVGVVDAMNLVSTTIKTFDNQIIVVPNGSIWGGVIKNITGSSTRRVDMTFGISYSDDIVKAAKILEDIVRSHNLVLKDPEPIVKLHELGDSSVNFVCRPWTKTSDYWTVYWDVTKAVKERFDKEGVSIPFPQRDVHIYQAGK